MATVLGIALATGEAVAQPRFEQWAKLSLPSLYGAEQDARAADADGDFDIDLLFAGFGLPVAASVYLNDGRGAYSRIGLRLPPMAGFGLSAAFLDADGDGDQDVAVGSDGGVRLTRNRLYLHDGKGGFRDVTATHLPSRRSRTWAVAVGDVDGDGDPDLVWGGLGVQNLLYLNDGKGRFTDATAAWMPADTKSTLALAVADLDGDGWPEVVAGNAGVAETNDVYWNQRGRGFVAKPLSGATETTKRVLVADVDVDGDPDVLVVNRGFGKRHELYLNDGKGRFTDGGYRLVGADRRFSAEAAVLADLDGDGDPDLFLGGQDTQRRSLRVHRNDGKAGFTDVTSAALPAGLKLGGVNGAVAADVDGDGDRDVVFSQSGILLPVAGYQLFNVTRHVFVPDTPRVGGAFTLEVFADPGHVVQPALAAARVPRPVRLGPLGWWWLDPAGTVVLAGVPVGSGRRSSLRIPVPADPWLSGRTFFYQGLDLALPHPARSRLTNFGLETIR